MAHVVMSTHIDLRMTLTLGGATVSATLLRDHLTVLAIDSPLGVEDCRIYTVVYPRDKQSCARQTVKTHALNSVCVRNKTWRSGRSCTPAGLYCGKLSGPTSSANGSWYHPDAPLREEYSRSRQWLMWVNYDVNS